MTASYDRDTRVIRPGTGDAAPAAPSPTPAEPTATAAPAPATASPSGEGGVVAELRPYFPRMALGAGLTLLAQLWWSGRHRRKERKRARKRRQRGRR